MSRMIPFIRNSRRLKKTADATHRIAHEVAVEHTRVTTQIGMSDRQQMLSDFRAERAEFKQEIISAMDKNTAVQKEWNKTQRAEQMEWMKINNYKLVTMLATTVGGVLLFADQAFGYKSQW